MFETIEPSQCRVALLCGGTSGEREISLASGQGALGALTEAGYSVEMFDPAKKEDLLALINGEFDVAFLCLHGKGGEDGVIQGFLELIGLPYTGSGVGASSIAIDKAKAKLFYERAGLLTPRSVTLYKDEPWVLANVISEVGEHCVIKAATEGSSLGVFIVEGPKAIEQALDEAFTYDNKVVVETYISGTELTVAVLGDEDAHALPIIEIIPQNDSYDFDSKYAPGGSRHICPARLSDVVSAEIQDAAIRAHKALGCSGVSRSDFILDEEGRFWLLETNTLPGMTATSLLPDAARAAGMTFPELCTLLIGYALKKAEK